MIRKYLDGGATEADGRANVPEGTSVATPLTYTSGEIIYIYIAGINFCL